MKLLRICCLLLLCANASCLKTVTMWTAIKNDGSVERHIKIDSQDAPDVESDLKLPPKDGWQVYRKEEKLFEARGQFKSVADIPTDFEKIADEEATKRGFKETSKSVKTYKAFKCALFNVHEYTETITDTTSRERFDDAVEQLIDLRKLGYEIAEKAYGDEYDFTAAKAYIEKEIVPRFRKLAAAYWEARTSKERDLGPQLLLAARKPLEELGLKLPEGNDDGGEITESIRAWMPAKLAELIKSKKGAPPTAEWVKERIDNLDQDEKLAAAAKDVIKERFGGPEQFEKHIQLVLVRLFGSYLQILQHGFAFDATVLMPGQVAETNGVINGDEVSWSFAHDVIFPRYRMYVRSVVFSKANEIDHARSLITSPRNALILADFVEGQKKADQERLLKALDELAKTRTPAALAQLAEGKDSINDLKSVLKKIGLAD